MDCYVLYVISRGGDLVRVKSVAASEEEGDVQRKEGLRDKLHLELPRCPETAIGAEGLRGRRREWRGESRELRSSWSMQLYSRAGFERRYDFLEEVSS